MDILFTHSPIHAPENFYRTVKKLPPNPGHKLFILCSVDSKEAVEVFAEDIADQFDSIQVIAKRYNSPTKEKEYEYFESRILSHLYVPAISVGPMMIVGKGEVPTEEFWADKCHRLILSSGVALTGYGSLAERGLFYPGTLLVNNFFNVFQIPKFPSPASHFRMSMRFENIHFSYPMKSEDLPMSGEVIIPDANEFKEIDEMKGFINRLNNKEVVAKKENEERREAMYGDGAVRIGTPIDKVQPKPSEENVRNDAITPFDLVTPPPAPVNEDVNVPIPDAPALVSVAEAKAAVEEPPKEPEKKAPVKKVAKKATKRATKRAPRKK